MKLKMCDIFDNSHQTAYTELIRTNIWHDMCNYVYDGVNRGVTSKLHSNVFMRCFVINNNKDMVRDNIHDVIYNTF